MKCGTEETMKMKQLYKVGPGFEVNSWSDSQLEIAPEGKSVVIVSNPTQVIFLQPFQRICQW